MCEKLGFKLLKFNVYGPLTGHIIDVHSFRSNNVFTIVFIYISITIVFSYLNYFSNITFSCSADRPCKISVVDVDYIKQFGKIYIKTTVSQVESHFLFKRYYRCCLI